MDFNGKKLFKEKYTKKIENNQSRENCIPNNIIVTKPNEIAAKFLGKIFE